MLLIGRYESDPAIGHAVCAVGFRDFSQPPLKEKSISFQDEAVSIIYLHDDNFGPNMRFKIDSAPVTGYPENICMLVWEPPSYVELNYSPDQTIKFIPSSLVVATHQELRLSTDRFYSEGWQKTDILHSELIPRLEDPSTKLPLSFSCRFVQLKNYLSDELTDQILDKDQLATVRLELQEHVPPMSLHIGVLRIVYRDLPLLDIIYDTTEAFPNNPFCCIAYEAIVSALAEVSPSWAAQLPKEIRAHTT